jgi:uroporphyrinogen III methyltransferase/synthase
LPVIEIGPPPDLAALDRAIDNLANYDWLVFTSANGVQNFIHRLREIGRDLRALGSIRLAAIGPRTAEALASFHLRPDFVPTDYRSESLAEGLSAQVAGRRVLLARADRGRDLLREELARIAQVDEVAVYSQRDVTEVDPEILRLLREGKIEFVTFTSSNIVRAFVKLLDEECRRRLGRETKLITISPVTSAVVRELGFEVAGDAAEYTAEGLVDALVSLAAPTP